MRTYPEYNKSNSKLTNKIPKDWGEASLKRTVDGCVNGIWGSEPNGKDDIACIRVADFDRASNSISTDKLTLRAVSYSERANRLVKNGDLLIEKSGGGDKTLVGAVAIYQHDFGAVTSNFVAKMRPRMGYSSTFLNYCFAALYSSNVNYCSIKQTTGIQNLDSEAYLQEKIGLPSYHEQQKIAQFLDYETAKIDALIDEQKRLIELLKEKRQAVISHAVTKGLNPDAPMKDSGVEWLGEVPEHWMVTRLKFASKIVDCKNRTPDYVENGGYLVVRTSNVKHGQLTTESAEYTDRTNFLEWTKRGVPPVNSILFTREAPAGEVCLVPADTPLCMGQRMMNIIPKNKSHTRFIFDFLTSDCLTKYINSVSHGSTVSHLRVEQVYDIPLVIPPANEQILIDQRVSKLKRSFSSLIETASLATDKLKERRSALISAAVTGKIDVRDWQPPAGSDTVDSNASMQTERHYG